MKNYSWMFPFPSNHKFMKWLNKIFLSFLLWLFFLHTYSQKTVTEQGEYMMRVETFMSENEATEKALKLAQINAIENAFGKVIVQGNSTFIQNASTGQKVETNNSFSFIADSYVNGEWLETLDEKKEIINAEDGSRWIKIKVKGKIREIKNITYSCETYTLSCPMINCKTSEFNDGQRLYVYFKSPKNGFISIYFDDPYKKITTRILPYCNSKADNMVNFPVHADEAYFLFSKEHDYLNDIDNINDLELLSDLPLEQYKIYVFFSPEEFDKPILDYYTNKMLTTQQINEGYTLPPSLPSENFQNWQLKVRGKKPDLEMQTILLTVRK
jgi:hypothetical protein